MKMFDVVLPLIQVTKFANMVSNLLSLNNRQPKKLYVNYPIKIFI